METAAIKNINSKLKTLPQALLEEVDSYIDYLKFKYSKEESIYIQKWQQDLVSERMRDPKPAVDAFEMIKKIEEDKE